MFFPEKIFSCYKYSMLNNTSHYCDVLRIIRGRQCAQNDSFARAFAVFEVGWQHCDGGGDDDLTSDLPSNAVFFGFFFFFSFPRCTYTTCTYSPVYTRIYARVSERHVRRGFYRQGREENKRQKKSPKAVWEARG